MKIFVFVLMVGLIIFSDVSGSRNVEPEQAATQRGDCECISVKRIRGDNCRTANSLRVEFRNTCGSAVNAQIYVRWSRDNAREKVGEPFSLRPGASSSYFWCQEPYEALVACE